MEANVFLFYVSLLVLSVLAQSSYGEVHEIPTVHLVKENESYNDVILKDDDFSPLSIIELRQKTNFLDDEMEQLSSYQNSGLKQLEQTSQQQTSILQEINGKLQNSFSSLDSRLNGVNDKVVQLSLNQNEGLARLEQSQLEQNEILQKLDSNIVGMENLLSSLDDRLNDIEKLGTANKQPESSFVTSNQLCGGLLVGRQGSIMFSKTSIPGIKYPSSCVWTIRANNYALIKVSTHPTYRTTYSNYISSSYVLEISKNSSNSSQGLQTKIIKLQSSMHHVFSGPIIFVVTSLLPQNDIDLYLSFEGIGKLVEKNTFFQHETLFANSGNFSSNELEYWTPSLLAQLDDNYNYTLDYTTIVISNFTSKVYLKVAFEEAGCSNGGSFIAITDLTDNGSSVIDCCQTRCEGNNSLINYNHPIIILVTKKFRNPLNFTVAWFKVPMYPSRSNSNLQCGNILGGTSGSITYKPNFLYLSNERCVWVIVPQPVPTSSVIIEVNENGIQDKFDFLYMMELTDVNGTELPNSPRITRLELNRTFVAQSREVYVVFYSDSTVVGNGFSLTWRVEGDYIKTGGGRATQFTIFRSNNGSATSVSEMIKFASSFYQVFILTPEVPLNYTYGLELQLNQTDANDCIQSGLSIFNPIDGLLSKTLPVCNNSGELVLDGDGMAIIVINSRNGMSEMTTDYKWKTKEQANSREMIQDNKCGSIINAESGQLNYKAGGLYLDNELCTWILQSHNDTGFTLKLIQEGFEACCDYLLVSTINSTTESAEPVLQSSIMNRANNAQAFEESTLIITFRSDGSTTGNGFILQFSPRGLKSHSEYNYKVNHVSDLYGVFEFPDANPLIRRNDIYIMVSSPALDTTSKGVQIQSSIVRQNVNSCINNSVTFYEVSGRSWAIRQRFPDVATCTNVDSVKKSYSPRYLAIYKPESANQSTHFRIEYSVAVTSVDSCGGNLRGKFGEISYKVNGTYRENERCSWTLEVPQAQRISFYLEQSRFEECCDYVTVSSANTPAVRFSAANRTASLLGSVATVYFHSDGSVNGGGFRLLFNDKAWIRR